jgi:hypothetical protein
MVELMTMLFPLSLFWTLEATWLGGWPVDAHGGRGIQQVLGLAVSYVLWIVVWKALNAALVPVIGPVLGGIFVTTVLAAVLLPFTTWVSFKIVGVSIKWSDAPAH